MTQLGDIYIGMLSTLYLYRSVWGHILKTLRYWILCFGIMSFESL